MAGRERDKKIVLKWRKSDFLVIVEDVWAGRYSSSRMRSSGAHRIACTVATRTSAGARRALSRSSKASFLRYSRRGLGRTSGHLVRRALVGYLFSSGLKHEQ